MTPRFIVEYESVDGYPFGECYVLDEGRKICMFSSRGFKDQSIESFLPGLMAQANNLLLHGAVSKFFDEKGG